MWWRRRKKEDRMSCGYRNKVSTGINKYIQTREKRVAGYLNHKTQGLTSRGKRYFFIGFCLLFGGLSLFQFLKPFFGTASKTQPYQPSSISVPAHVDKTGEDHTYPESLVTEEDINELWEFRLYMDSLKRIPNGKVIYDSILAARPGLMDTVLMLEQLYYQQKK